MRYRGEVAIINDVYVLVVIDQEGNERVAKGFLDHDDRGAVGDAFIVDLGERIVAHDKAVVLGGSVLIEAVGVGAYHASAITAAYALAVGDIDVVGSARHPRLYDVGGLGASPAAPQNSV